MELRELRIGNYISPLGRGITKVEGFCIWDGLIQSSNFSERGIEDFEPIQLTEDMLFRCGFKKHNDHKSLYSIKTENGIIFTVYCKTKTNGLDTVFDRWGVLGISNWICNIEYFHQLQNLYFALIGEELEIK